MGHFDGLLARARPVVKEAIADVDADIFNPDFAVADVSLQAMEDLVPEDVSAAWCIAMLSERPELMKEPADGDSVAEVIRSAVIELVLSNLDDEMRKHVDALRARAGAPTP